MWNLKNIVLSDQKIGSATKSLRVQNAKRPDFFSCQDPENLEIKGKK